MLYDNKRWDKQSAPSLEGFIDWLEKQPADQSYDWHNIHKCPVCQYLRAAKGWKYPTDHYSYPDLFRTSTQYGEICATFPWTFGAALEQARKAVA